jgi:hypothetical protein
MPEDSPQPEQPVSGSDIYVSPMTDPLAPSPKPLAAEDSNTSGRGSSAVVPEEVKGWSWGAFTLTWIWGIGNNVWTALLVFVPVVGLVMYFVLGLKGREWAWKAKHWDSVEHFKKTQRTWDLWRVSTLPHKPKTNPMRIHVVTIPRPSIP